MTKDTRLRLTSFLALVLLAGYLIAAVTYVVDTIQASGAGGVTIKDDGGNLGVYVEDGGQVGIGGTPNADFDVADADANGSAAMVVGDNNSVEARVYLYGDATGAEPQHFFYSAGNSDDISDYFVLQTGGTASTDSNFKINDSGGSVVIFHADQSVDLTDANQKIKPETTQHWTQFCNSSGTSQAYVDHDDGNIQSNGNITFDYPIIHVHEVAWISNKSAFDPGDAGILRISCDNAAGVSFQGMTGGAAGRTMQILNVGDYDLTIECEDGTASAENRFHTNVGNADVVLDTDDGVTVWYDGTSARWRVHHMGIGAY